MAWEGQQVYEEDELLVTEGPKYNHGGRKIIHVVALVGESARKLRGEFYARKSFEAEAGQEAEATLYRLRKKVRRRLYPKIQQQKSSEIGKGEHSTGRAESGLEGLLDAKTALEGAKKRSESYKFGQIICRSEKRSRSLLSQFLKDGDKPEPDGSGDKTGGDGADGKEGQETEKDDNLDEDMEIEVNMNFDLSLLSENEPQSGGDEQGGGLSFGSAAPVVQGHHAGFSSPPTPSTSPHKAREIFFRMTPTPGVNRHEYYTGKGDHSVSPRRPVGVSPLFRVGAPKCLFSLATPPSSPLCGRQGFVQHVVPIANGFLELGEDGRSCDDDMNMGHERDGPFDLCSEGESIVFDSPEPPPRIKKRSRPTCLLGDTYLHLRPSIQRDCREIFTLNSMKRKRAEVNQMNLREDEREDVDPNDTNSSSVEQIDELRSMGRGKPRGKDQRGGGGRGR